MPAPVRTDPPALDLEDLFPLLVKQRATAVRLHPRPDPTVAPDSSHVGSPLLWPAEEPWPSSDEPQHPARRRGGPGHADDEAWDDPAPNHRFVAVLQLTRADVPELGFPGKTDLFQLLWNPRLHPGRRYTPIVRAFWRRAGAITRRLEQQPPAEHPDEGLVPRPCSLSPERIAEHPAPAGLPPKLAQQLREWGDRQDRTGDYHQILSAAPGLKVGGHPRWGAAIDPQPVICSNGHPMALLLTIDGTEWDAGSGPRWRARAAGRPLLDPRPTGLQVGRGASLLVFVCRSCPGLPMRAIQS